MLIRVFVSQVRANLDTLNELQSKKHEDPELTEEATKTIAIINDLLNQLESTSGDDMITNRSQLQILYQYLIDWWDENAATQYSYKVNPKSKGNRAREELQKALTFLPYTLKKFPRKRDEILMPYLAGHTFVRDIMRQLAALPHETPTNVGLFAYIESQQFIAALRNILQGFAGDAPLNAASLAPCLQFLRDRGARVIGTETNGDKVCAMLAYKLSLYVNVNVHDVSAKQDITPFLPVSPAENSQQRLDLIKRHIMENLAAYPVILTDNLINMETVKELGLDLIQQLEEKPSANLPANVQLESKARLVEIKRILSARDKNTFADLMGFFRRRWQRIAGLEQSYQRCSGSNVNIVCDFLSDAMTVLNDKAGQPLLTKKAILRPEILVSDFANYMLAELSLMPQDNPRAFDLYTYLESEATLLRMQKILLVMRNDRGRASAETLARVINFWIQRADKLADTQDDPNNNPNTRANKFRAFMAQQAVIYAHTNTDQVPFNEKTIFKSTIVRRGPNKFLREILAEEFKNDEAGTRELRENLGFSYNDLCAQLLQQIKSLPDDVDAMPWQMYLESRQMVKSLEELLTHEAKNVVPPGISHKILEPLLDFLRCRPPVTANKITRAHKACELLADGLYVTGMFSDVRLNRELMLNPPLSSHRPQEMHPINSITTKDELLATAFAIKPTDWYDFYTAFDKTKLKLLVKGDAPSYQMYIDTPGAYTEDEQRSRAILCANLMCYIVDRANQGTYKSTASYLLNPLFTIPTETQKVNAAKAALDYFVSGKPIAKFREELNQPNTTLYAHREFLIEPKSELNKQMEHIFVAASRLDAAVSAPQHTQG